jgi:Fur family ferric uptake transcriptional regulator
MDLTQSVISNWRTQQDCSIEPENFMAKYKKQTKDAILSVESSRELLRKSNLRCTPTRLSVLEYLSGQGRPVSHAEISEAMVPLGYDKSTLYRVLIELTESQILSRIDAGDHSWRFELIGREAHSSEGHPHFVCDACGRVECLPESGISIADFRKSKTGKQLQIREIFLKGTCRDCS